MWRLVLRGSGRVVTGCRTGLALRGDVGVVTRDRARSIDWLALGRAAWVVPGSRARLALRGYARGVAGNGAWLILRRDAWVVTILTGGVGLGWRRLTLRGYARVVAGNRTRRRREARRVTRNGRRLTLRGDARVVAGNRARRRGEAGRVPRHRRKLILGGHIRSVSRNRRVGRRRRRYRCRHRSWCRYMAMLAGWVCRALTQIEPLITHIDVRLVLQAVAAYERLHDMAVGAGVVIDAAEASQSGAM